MSIPSRAPPRETGPPRRQQMGGGGYGEIDYQQLTGEDMALPVGSEDDEMFLAEISQQRSQGGR